MANDVVVRVIAKDEASKSFKEVSQQATGLGKVLGDVGKIASGFLAANVIQGGFQKLTGFIGDSVAAARESIMVNAQLEAVLKSTGRAGEISADIMRANASALERMSLFEDEAIIGAENLLLTFVNIGATTMPRATQAVLDMSQALGQDLKSSSIQLGKALNDPILGITALSRVGVSFTEQQKKTIAAMAEAGDVAGAQALILAELEKEFGGSAKAASDAAGSTEKYKDRMNELKEQIGEKLLPIQERWKQLQLEIVAVIANNVIPALDAVAQFIDKNVIPPIDALVGVAAELKRLFDLGLGGGEIGGEFSTLQQAAFDLGEAFRTDVIPAFNDAREAMRLFILGFEGGEIGGAWASWQEAAVMWGQQTRGAVDNVKAVIEALVTTFKGPFTEAIVGGLSVNAQYFMSYVRVILDGLGFVIALLNGDFPLAWDRAKAAAAEAVTGIVNHVLGMLDVMRGFVADFGRIGLDLANSLINGIKSALSNFTIRIHVGGVDMPSPIPDIPGFDSTVRPFTFLAKGLPYVPYDNFPALLHKGEAVIPASQNPAAGGSAAGMQPVTVNLYVSGSILSERDVTRIVRDAITGGGFRGVFA